MSTFEAIGLLLAGLLAGYLGAYYRSRHDMLMMREYAALTERHREEQLRAVAQSQQQAQLDDAYAQLKRWLTRIERTVEEIFYGCVSPEAQELKIAERMIEEWTVTAFRIPVDLAPAEYYWSSSVRELIREMYSTSHFFIVAARAALRDHPDVDVTWAGRFSELHDQRNKTVDSIERIVEMCREDLGIKNLVPNRLMTLEARNTAPPKLSRRRWNAFNK